MNERPTDATIRLPDGVTLACVAMEKPILSVAGDRPSEAAGRAQQVIGG